MNSILKRYEDISNEISDYQNSIEKLEYTLTESTKKLNSYLEKSNVYLEEKKILDMVMGVFTMMSDERTNEAVGIIQETLNYALERISLEQDFRADIISTGTELSFSLIDKRTNNIYTTRFDVGTAVSQIVSVLTILVILKLSNSSKILVLDETLYGIQDTDSIKMFTEVLSALAENEDFQILWVEHKSAIDQVEEVNVLKLGLTPDVETKIVSERNYEPNSEKETDEDED